MASEAAIDDASTVGSGPGRPVESIAGKVQFLPNGERAQLRRLYLTERPSADGIVFRLLYHAGLTGLFTPEAAAPWRLLTHCAALLAGTGQVGKPPHAHNARLGDVLQQSGYSENRLSRLLNAQGAALQDQVIGAVRMVAQKGKGPINLRTLFDLICNDPDRSERARLRIARDYYAAEARSDGETSSDD